MNRRDFLGTMGLAGTALALPTSRDSDAWASILASIGKLAGLGWTWQVFGAANSIVVALPGVGAYKRIEMRGPASAMPALFIAAIQARMDEVHT